MHSQQAQHLRVQPLVPSFMRTGDTTTAILVRDARNCSVILLLSRTVFKSLQVPYIKGIIERSPSHDHQSTR